MASADDRPRGMKDLSPLWKDERFYNDPGGPPKPKSRAPSTITVLDGTDLQRSGVRFLSDALRLVPGLEVLRTTSTESNVSARGYNDAAATAQGMLGLIDGRQVYNEFFGNVLWDTLPVSMDEIERIEVIRGPGSFLYGPNAMHGLVNIVTKSPLDYERDIVLLSAAGGSYESTVATATYVKREDRAGLKATLGWDNVARFQPRDEGSSDKGFLQLQYETLIGENQRLDVKGGILKQNQELIIPTTLGIPPANLSNDVQEGFIDASYSIGDLQARVVWNGFDATSDPNRIYVPFDVDLDTLNVDLRYSATLWDNHSVTAGAGYRYSTFKTTDFDVADGRHSTDLVWGFIQDEIRFSDHAFVTAGVRVDWHSTSGTNVSPRVAGVWEFKDEQFLRASAGFGFRNPSLRENWFDMPLAVPGLPGPVTIAGNDDLDAEKIISFELGYFGTPMARLKGGVNVFYNLVDDLIVFRPVAFFPSPPNPPGIPSTVAPFNTNDEEVYGVELEVDYLFSDSFSAFGNYSYEVREDRNTHDRILTAPRNKANAGVRWSSTDRRVNATLWLNYFDETEFSSGVADAYVLLNGQISYDFVLGNANGQVYVRAFNLVDGHREHPDGQIYDEIVMAGVNVAW